jgi:hypothetical protein
MPTQTPEQEMTLAEAVAVRCQDCNQIPNSSYEICPDEYGRDEEWAYCPDCDIWTASLAPWNDDNSPLPAEGYRSPLARHLKRLRARETPEREMTE